MRVCHVSPHLPPDQAANALLPAELGRWAAARGDEVTFAAHEPAQGRASSDALAGPVTWIPRRGHSRIVWRALRLDAWRHLQVINAALDRAARRADLLHLHSNGLIIEAAAAWAARHRVPYILTLYGTEIWHYRRRWPIDPFARAYRRAAAVTFYSQRLLDKARELGLDRRRLSVIYPAVGSAFAPQDERTRSAWREALGIREPHVILNVKRLHELAGQRFLIEAFARVARGRHDLRLVICGTGPLRQDLEALAQSLGIERIVTFTGLVANDEVARYAAIADVFALPSLLEALPTVAVEALAAGTPVISADHPGGVELHAIFGDDVLVVPRSNVDALAGALKDFLDAPARVRAGTLELIGKHFGPAAVHAAYDAVYRRAVEGPH
ncbi:MAG: glycosyltransferase [Vicinamibacterales bacterium]